MAKSKKCFIFDLSNKRGGNSINAARLKMLVKGTPEYKRAQLTANKIQRIAGYTRWHESSRYDLYIDDFAWFISDVAKVEGFAGQVAATVEQSIKPMGYKIANLSAKQAWIISCAAVENNVKFPFDDEDESEES